MTSTLTNLVSMVRYKLMPSKIISNYVKVETSAECNARCVWCWMFKSQQKPRGFMRLDDYKHFIDINKTYFLAHNIGIMPFFNGECLIHPKIFGILDYTVHNKLHLMDLDTNLGVKIDIAKLMSYPFKHIRVNIGGITKEIHENAMYTNFDVVVENLKKAFKINPEKIFVKMVITKTNVNQISTMGNFIKSLGGRAENKIAAETGFALPSLASDKEIKEFFDNVVSDKIDGYLKFDYDRNKERYGIRTKKHSCQYLLNCITFDGKLTICCQDQLGKLNLGNAFQVPMIELVTSPRYKASLEKAKNMAFDFCQECN